jgi:OHCU decarboxylase
LAVAGHLTNESTSEQAGAGLNHCSQDELSEFQVLNHNYSEKFGHPFIIAVRGLNRHKILVEFRRRLTANPEEEFLTALSEVHKIALSRLQALSQK